MTIVGLLANGIEYSRRKAAVREVQEMECSFSGLKERREGARHAGEYIRHERLEYDEKQPKSDGSEDFHRRLSGGTCA